MTFHLVQTFNDPERNEQGYLLCCDSRVENKRTKEIDWMDKGFVGQNYSGMIMGSRAVALGPMEVEDWAALFAAHLKHGGQTREFAQARDSIFDRANRRTLESAFTNIADGVSYAHVPALQRLDEAGMEYWLTIASKSGHGAQLYAITNETAHNRHTARLVSTLEYKAGVPAHAWFAGPGVPASDKHLHAVDLKGAAPTIHAAGRSMLRFFVEPGYLELVAGEPTYDPGEPNFYVVSSHRNGRLPIKDTAWRQKLQA